MVGSEVGEVGVGGWGWWCVGGGGERENKFYVAFLFASMS